MPSFFVSLNFQSYVDKFSSAQELKLAGNELYKSGEVKKALGKYHRALLYIKGIESDLNDKQGKNIYRLIDPQRKII